MQDDISRFKFKYPQYTFLRTTISNWKRKLDNENADVPLSKLFQR